MKACMPGTLVVTVGSEDGQRSAQTDPCVKTYSAGSRRINRSIAAEKAANARPPPTTAFGPEFRARIPPATKPAPTEL